MSADNPTPRADGLDDTAELPLLPASDAPQPAAPQPDAPSGGVDRAGASRARRARRWALWIVGLLVALGALVAGVVVADGVVRRNVEHTLAGQLHEQLRTPDEPAVYMTGNPFLTQVAEHRYREVVIDAPGATIEDLSFNSLTVHAQDVRTRANNTEGTIGALQGDGVVSYASVGAKAGVNMEFDSPGKLRITYPGKVFGHQVSVLIVGRPELDEGAQNVSLRDITSSVEGVNLPQFIVRQAASVLIKPVGLALPPGMKVTSIDPQADGLHVAVSGSNVELSSLR